MQQRLARCEELLQEYATAKPPSTSGETPNSGEPWKSLGKLVKDDSGVRFMDSFLWATVHDEVWLHLISLDLKAYSGASRGRWDLVSSRVDTPAEDMHC